MDQKTRSDEQFAGTREEVLLVAIVKAGLFRLGDGSI